MKIDDAVIKQIEKALGFKLYERQIKVIKDNDWSGFIPGQRRQGRTMAHIIRLALSEGELITDKFKEYADGYYSDFYHEWYRREFLYIRGTLKEHGLNVIEVVTPNRRKV